MKRSHKFRLFSNLTFENINNIFEARNQEKEVFMNCSQLHWSDKKTVDENVSLLCIPMLYSYVKPGIAFSILEN